MQVCIVVYYTCLCQPNRNPCANTCVVIVFIVSAILPVVSADRTVIRSDAAGLGEDILGRHSERRLPLVFVQILVVLEETYFKYGTKICRSQFRALKMWKEKYESFQIDVSTTPNGSRSRNHRMSPFRESFAIIRTEE